MRVAIFAETFLPKWDGVANTLCHLLDHLALGKWESLMFAPTGAPSRYADTPIVGLPSLTFPFYPELKIVPPVVNVTRELAAFRPDVVHLVNPALLGLVGLRHAHSLRVPVVASYHTDIPGYANLYGLDLLNRPLWKYFSWIHNQADLNLAPSEFTRLELEAHGFQRVGVWGHGVDTTRFSPRHRRADVRQQLSGGRPEAPLLLYVGRLAAEKRVEWLRPVLQALPGARLAIVGDGPRRAFLENLFRDLPVVFTGYLEGLELSRAYAAADLFVFPSANETFGNVILEAMASQLPVVAVRSGGPVNHVFDGVNGWLCDPDAPQDMLRRVQFCLGRPALMETLGRQARRYAETQSWELVMDSLLESYTALAERRSVTSRYFHCLAPHTLVESQHLTA